MSEGYKTFFYFFQADEIEKILCHKFTRFMMMRAENFTILRRKQIEVCRLALFSGVFFFFISLCLFFPKYILFFFSHMILKDLNAGPFLLLQIHSITFVS